MHAVARVSGDDQVGAVQRDSIRHVHRVAARPRQPITPLRRIERGTVELIAPDLIIAGGRIGPGNRQQANHEQSQPGQHLSPPKPE